MPNKGVFTLGFAAILAQSALTTACYQRAWIRSDGHS